MSTKRETAGGFDGNAAPHMADVASIPTIDKRLVHKSYDENVLTPAKSIAVQR